LRGAKTDDADAERRALALLNALQLGPDDPAYELRDMLRSSLK
jgi:hypothetical protein